MHDLTKGSIARNLLQTASFMLVGMVFQTLYFLVDLYFVGRLGKSAVAAVSLSGNLMFFVLALTQTLGVGTTALIAHATGRKDRDDARRIFNQSQVLALAVGLVFLAVAMAMRDGFARGQSADPETARLASEYLTWFIPSLAGQFAMVATGAALRGIGDFKPGMILQTATVVLNIVLAPALMFGWGTGHPLGVAGTAIASFVAVVVGVVGLIGYVIRKRGYLEFVAREWRPRLAMWGRMLAIGLPAGAEFALMGVYMAVVYAITRRFGAGAQAGFGIGLRVIQAGFMPVVALGFAVSPVAGQNFGARLPERVRATFRIGALMAISAMAVLLVICRVVPEPLVGVFNKDPGVLAVGGEYLKIVAWNFVPSGVVFVSSSMFQALGNTIPPLASSLVRTCLLAIPAYLMSRMPGFALNWIWYLSVAVVAIHMTLNLLLLRREYRRKLAFAAPAAAPSAPALAAE
ncbi:MAG TPA: MATE family efflux transporter [Polyangia bacterium]|jgi:putative MATE family efflux protein|nr:MATE family efflux transporter [Polyangia bacterium]